MSWSSGPGEKGRAPGRTCTPAAEFRLLPGSALAGAGTCWLMGAGTAGRMPPVIPAVRPAGGLDGGPLVLQSLEMRALSGSAFHLLLHFREGPDSTVLPQSFR